jgi:hypothetical protein
MILYIEIFTFSDSRRRYESFWPKW